MEGAGAHLHVVGLLEDAPLGGPVGVEGEDQVLEQHGSGAVAGRSRAGRQV